MKLCDSKLQIRDAMVQFKKRASIEEKVLMNLRGTYRFTRVIPASQYRRIVYLFFQQILAIF